MEPERTFLRAGEPAWEDLDREKRAARRRFGGSSVEDLLRAGQRLSAQAAALRRAIRHDRRPLRP